MTALKRDRVEKLALGRPGAMLVHENDAGVFVERWKPRLAGRFVGLDGQPNLFKTRQEAEDCARHVKIMAQAAIAAADGRSLKDRPNE